MIFYSWAFVSGREVDVQLLLTPTVEEVILVNLNLGLTVTVSVSCDVLPEAADDCIGFT